jgi:hypothetical protein
MMRLSQNDGLFSFSGGQGLKESGNDFNGVHIPETENDDYSPGYGQFVELFVTMFRRTRTTPK